MLGSGFIEGNDSPVDVYPFLLDPILESNSLSFPFGFGVRPRSSSILPSLDMLLVVKTHHRAFMTLGNGISAPEFALQVINGRFIASHSQPCKLGIELFGCELCHRSMIASKLSQDKRKGAG